MSRVFNHNNGRSLDLETLGTRGGCVILSVGICRFNIETKQISDKFYVQIDGRDAIERFGMKVEKEVLDWWATQDKKLFKELTTTNLTPHDVAMQQVADYLSRNPSEPIWAWGNDFDMPILRGGLDSIDIRGKAIDKLYRYSKLRDTRTLSGAFGVAIERSKGHHHALTDAVEQAQYIIDFFNDLM